MSYEAIFECPEPRGKVRRHVRPMELQDIGRVYKEIRTSLESRGKTLPEEVAVAEFSRLDKVYWVVDGVGLVLASSAGDMHVFFWDKRLRGRERMCRGMAYMIMDFFRRSFLWVKIPRKERTALAFARRVGFKEQSSDAESVVLRFDREVT